MPNDLKGVPLAAVEGFLGRLIGVASAMKGWFVWPHGVGGNEVLVV